MTGSVRAGRRSSRFAPSGSGRHGRAAADARRREVVRPATARSGRRRVLDDLAGGDNGRPPGCRSRLEKYLAKATGRFLTVPDPRLAVLRDIPTCLPGHPHPADRAGIH